MADEFLIRPGRSSDAPGLARIQVANFQSDYANLLPQGFLEIFSVEDQEQDWNEILQTPSDEAVLVAEKITGQVAGYAIGRRSPWPAGGFEVELQSLHVKPGERGRGIGRSLISAVAARYLEAGQKGLYLWVLAENPARRLYERLGGELLGRKEWENNAYFETRIFEIAYGWQDLKGLMTATGRGRQNERRTIQSP